MAKTNKRKTRIFILSVCILLVLIAAVAFFGHQLLFNNLDQDEKAAIDDEVGKITQSIVEEILNSDTDYFSETAGTDSGENAEGSPQTSQSEGEPNSQPDSKEDRIASVIAKYENGFEKLKREADAILARLVEEIKADYKALKASGGGKTDLIRLGASYTNKVNAYESSFDSGVTLLLSKMGEDLRAAGMPEGEVKDYIRRVEAEYKEIKEKRQAQMLDKAKEYL